MITAVARRAGAVALVLLLASCAATTSGTPSNGNGSGGGPGGGSGGGSGGSHSPAAPTLGKVWTARIDGAAGSNQQLTAGASGGGNIYVSDVSGYVFGLAGSNGKVLWKVHPGRRSGSGAAYAGGRVFFTDTDTGLYALDPGSGRTVWHVARGFITATHNTLVPVSRGIVVLPDESDGVNGLRVSTGKRVWHRARGGVELDYPAADARNVYLAGGGAGTGRAVLRAINPVTGATRWQRTMPVSERADVEVYALAGLVVLLATTSNGNSVDDVMTAFVPGTGRTRWTTKAVGIQGSDPPVAVGGVLAFPSLKGVEGLSTASGKALYTTAMDAGPADAVARCGDLVCGYGIDTVVALDSTGKKVADAKADDDDAQTMASTSAGPVYLVGSGTVSRYSR